MGLVWTTDEDGHSTVGVGIGVLFRRVWDEDDGSIFFCFLLLEQSIFFSFASLVFSYLVLIVLLLVCCKK